MFCVLIIGNSQSYMSRHAMASGNEDENAIIVTPRGYYREQTMPSVRPMLSAEAASAAETVKPGQAIMQQSFRTILAELDQRRGSNAPVNFPLGHLWTLLHAIHTTADFEMEQLLYSDPGAVETIYNKVRGG